MADDLIRRQAAIDALAIGEELLKRALDQMYVVGNAREKYEFGIGLIESYINDIEDLPSAQRWIPVSERLPEEDLMDVLVTDDSGGLATIGTDCMFTIDGTGIRAWLVSQRVTAWMYLPEPYKEEEK